MANINQVLYTAQQAIMSNLTAINVTGSNISNVNTDGYTRQRAIFEAVGTTDSTSSQEQTGVRIAAVEQIYDKFLESQIVGQKSSVANYSTQQDYLQRIEAVLNESDDGGVNNALSEFLNAWGDLSADPSSKAKRDQVVTTGQNLAYIFNQRADSLTDIQTSANDNVADNVNILNGYLKEMAELNETVVNTESAGGNAAAVRDKRQELLKKISEIVDVNYIENNDGSLYITLTQNGKALVQGSKSWELEVQRNSSNNNMYDIVFSENPTQSINDEIRGGKLGGLLTIRDEMIPSYLDELNQTASSIVNKVNDLHMSGYDQDGNAGEEFFVVTGSGDYADAKYMAVNTAIADDTRKIAASATVNADGNNAAYITSIADDQMYASLGSITFTSSGGTSATGEINNIGQTYKDTTSDITLTRGTTSGSWTVTNNGGYSNISVLSQSTDSKVLLDFDGDSTADMTLNLTGTWANTDTLSFGLTKDSSTTAIDGYYNAFIANMGQDVDNVSQRLDSETTILNQQVEQREQVSGVSLDEEMLNLVKYQMAYSASGKLTSIINEMIDVLIKLGQ